MATQSHVVERTNRRPSRRSRYADVGSRPAVAGGCLCIERIMTAENAKVAASATKAQPGPAVPTRTPPMAGPSRVAANGRTNSPSAFAWTNSSAGTRSGTMAALAGVNNAWPHP